MKINIDNFGIIITIRIMIIINGTLGMHLTEGNYERTYTVVYWPTTSYLE